jgi:hypothetical protein
VSGIDKAFDARGFTKAVFDAEGRIVYEPTQAARDHVATIEQQDAARKGA